MSKTSPNRSSAGRASQRLDEYRNALNDLLENLAEFKDGLEHLYPAQTLWAMARYFQELSVEYREHLEQQGSPFYAVIAADAQLSSAAERVADMADALATQLEQYARSPQSYSWVGTRRLLNRLTIAVGNLHEICASVSRTSQRTRRSGKQRIADTESGTAQQMQITPMRPRLLAQATVAARKSLTIWLQLLQARPRLELGANDPVLVGRIGADLARLASVLRGLCPYFDLRHTSLAEAAQFFAALGASEDACALAQEVATSIGSRRNTLQFAEALRYCLDTLDTVVGAPDIPAFDEMIQVVQ
jgi:hypothetical protein